MGVLLDSHTFLWIATAPEKLSKRARTACANEKLVLSAASVWEISIKCRIGRLQLPGEPGECLLGQIRHARISVLPIQFRHAVTAAALPGGHEDPFDRMLAAQCIEEGLPFVTRDPLFATWGLRVIW